MPTRRPTVMLLNYTAMRVCKNKNFTLLNTYYEPNSTVWAKQTI